MKKSALLVVASFCLIIAGCQHPGPNRFDPRAELPSAAPEFETVTLTNRIPPEWLKPSQDPFRLGPGDKLEIELLDDLTSRITTPVGPDGKIYFNLLPGLDVWGKTLAQTKDLIETELAKYIRDKPQVMITLRAVDSQRVWLLGRFQNPGVYPMTTPVTLLEAIAHAGGTANIGTTKDFSVAENTAELADLRRAFIIRNGKPLPVDFQKLVNDGDLSQNLYLQSDDFVYLPAAASKEVFVLGAVTYPRTVPHTEDLTLASAIANSYGTIKDAYLTHVAIVRGSLSKPQIAIVDYNKIIRGTATDIKLEPQDIVYVPFTPYRLLTKYADVIMNTFVSSVAINEGSRAVLPTPAQPAGVFIPLGSRITVTPAPPIR